MPRIPPEEIERLKQEIPIQRLAEARGIKFSTHGKDLVGLCPFHPDKNPSLVLTPEKNLWHCLGACNAGGSVIDWVMKAESVSFPHAVQILREMPEVLMQSKNIYENPPVQRRSERFLKNPFDSDMSDREILQQVVSFYHSSLKDCPDALKYLEKRGLNKPEIIEQFQIGASNQTLCYRLPTKSGRWGAALRQRLWHLGIHRKSGHEHYNNFLTFPIFDENGTVAQIYGRRFTMRREASSPNHLDLSGPHKGVFNLEGLKTSREIILCKGIIDALTFWNAGFHNVTASCGVKAFTTDHLAAFKKNSIERVYIAYGQDEAGMKAANELSEKLIGEGFEVFQIFFPSNMDANDYGRKMKPASKAFALAIEQAVCVGGKRVGEISMVSGSSKEEPKAATKEENISVETPSLETVLEPVESPEEPQQPEPENSTLLTHDSDDREILRQVIDFYHRAIKENPEALGYLEKRGLKNSEMIDHFRIGYSDRTLGLRFPNADYKSGLPLRYRMAQLGIIRETGHELFQGSIVFPIFDEHGNVSEIYGRKAADVGRLRAGTVYHLYLPGPHKGVWNASALAASPDVILCEAIIDALTFWCAGFRNVTASYGVNGFTSDHLEIFRKACIKRVFIAYDRDNAGEKAAEDLAPRLIGEGFEVFRILFPYGMDANAYALKARPPEKHLGVLFRNAVWMGKGRQPMTENPHPVFPSIPETRDHPEATEIKEKTMETISQPGNSIFSLAAQTVSSESSGPVSARSASESNLLELETEIRGEEIIMHLDDRRWRIRGLSKNMSYDQLKINLLVSRGEAYFVDTFDLYSAKSRTGFQKQAAEEIRVKEDVIRYDLGKILLKLEEIQDRQIREALEPKVKPVIISDEDRAAALELLHDPRLIDRILEDFKKCGIIGEENNKLVCYLASVSRKLETPIAAIIQSSSAAGKTSLMESVLAFMPEEERVKYSAMTGQSLFYMGETNLKHKILAIVEEEGAERASYALKLLQSEGELTIASTGKDPQTGRMITHEYRVEGPVMIFVTTTAIDIDDELQNRCLVLTVNESREQTQAIHRLQRERRTLEGLRARKEKGRILRCHRNAQRLLKPIPVINPYAPRLTFLDDRTRTRRDHDRYLDLIEAITLLHQYQRQAKTDYDEGKPYQFLEVQLEDIELANRLMHEVLGRSLDEIPPQTRRLLLLLEKMVTEGCQRLNIEREVYRFSRRDVREYTGYGNTQIMMHLQRLEELEYVLAYRSNRGQNFVYELAYDGKGKDGKPFLHGLLDVTALRQKYDAANSGQKVDFSAPNRPQIGGMSGPFRGENIAEEELQESTPEIIVKNTSKIAHQEEQQNVASYLPAAQFSSEGGK
ncbi:MAG: toprim domain-containing protein [Candidatus Riflebacteria bacterium]|nr:toprim domain-containing protein [Candidatus Riflebacteria bacterium]